MSMTQLKSWLLPDLWCSNHMFVLVKNTSSPRQPARSSLASAPPSRKHKFPKICGTATSTLLATTVRCDVYSVLQPFRHWHIEARFRDFTPGGLLVHRDDFFCDWYRKEHLSVCFTTRSWMPPQDTCCQTSPILLVLSSASTLHQPHGSPREMLRPVSRQMHECVGCTFISRQFFVSASSGHAHGKNQTLNWKLWCM